MIEKHPYSSDDAECPKSDDTNSLAFHQAEWDVTRPDIDFLSPSQYNEEPEMMPPREFPHRTQSKSLDNKPLLEAKVIYKHLSMDSNHPSSSDPDSDLFRKSDNQTLTQRRSSHNRNVGYTLHTSTDSDYSFRKEQAAKKAAEFEQLLDEQSPPI